MHEGTGRHPTTIRTRTPCDLSVCNGMKTSIPRAGQPFLLAAMLSCIVAMLCIATAGCAGTGAIPFESGEERYRFEVQLQPVPGMSGKFDASASVTDLKAERTISMAPFTLEKGENKIITATDSASGAEFDLAIGIDDTPSSLKWYAAVKKAGRLIASHAVGIRKPEQLEEPRQEMLR